MVNASSDTISIILAVVFAAFMSIFSATGLLIYSKFKTIKIEYVPLDSDNTSANKAV